MSGILSRLWKKGTEREITPLSALLMLLPLLLIYAFVFVQPVFEVLSKSVLTPEFSLEHYQYIFADTLYLGVMWRTVRVGCLVTAICLLVGYPVASLMARSSGWKLVAISVCVLVPLWLSILVRSYSWVVLLSRNGLITSALRDWGIIGSKTQLMFTDGAVILAMVHVLLPFMIMPIYSTLKSIPDDYDYAAQSLGASPLRAFAEVKFKLSLPGVFSGAVLVFVQCLGFFITPQLVGGPGSALISMLISREVTVGNNWGLASALSVLIFLSAIIVVAIFGKFTRPKHVV